MTGELLGAKSNGHDFRGAERSAIREADDDSIVLDGTPRGGIPEGRRRIEQVETAARWTASPRLEREREREKRERRARRISEIWQIIVASDNERSSGYSLLERMPATCRSVLAFLSGIRSRNETHVRAPTCARMRPT